MMERKLNCAAPCDELNEQHDQSDDQQNMDVCSEDMEPDES